MFPNGSECSISFCVYMRMFVCVRACTCVYVCLFVPMRVCVLLRHPRMARGVLRCSEMSLAVLRILRMSGCRERSRDVRRCLMMSWHLLAFLKYCPEMSPGASQMSPDASQMPPDASRCLQMLPRCLQMPPRCLPDASQMLPEASRCLQKPPDASRGLPDASR